MISSSGGGGGGGGSGSGSGGGDDGDSDGGSGSGGSGKVKIDMATISISIYVCMDGWVCGISIRSISSYTYSLVRMRSEMDKIEEKKCSFFRYAKSLLIITVG